MKYVKFEPSQHTVMEYTRRFSYRQSRNAIFHTLTNRLESVTYVGK